VPDEKLSLAIGKKGQNVRLASQLTGWRIDIHSESKVREMEARSRASISGIEGISPELAETLFRQGWRSAADVANARPEELVSLPTLTNAEAAAKLIASAKKAAEKDRLREAQEMAEAAARREAESEGEPGAQGAADSA